MTREPTDAKDDRMNIETVDVTDPAVVEQLLDVKLAAHAVDEPDNPAPCRVHFRAATARPNPDEEQRFHAVRVDGRIVGFTDLYFPLKENRHFAYANAVVHPDHRRRGIGGALVTNLLDFTREAGRRNLNLDVLGTWEDGPKRSEAGKRLLERLGFTLALTEVNRYTDITALDPAVEQRLLDEALAKSEDYETVVWHHRMPEELLAPIAKLNSIFFDEAPLGDLALEAQRMDAERMRQIEQRSLDRGLEVCGVVARPKGSTEVVANTVIGVPTEPGDIAHQWLTLVDPNHRGHRLGMRIKVANLRNLRRVRPQVKRIFTDNADVNAHMVAINDALGFRPIDAILEYQIDL